MRTSLATLALGLAAFSTAAHCATVPENPLLLSLCLTCASPAANAAQKEAAVRASVLARIKAAHPDWDVPSDAPDAVGRVTSAVIREEAAMCVHATKECSAMGVSWAGDASSLGAMAASRRRADRAPTAAAAAAAASTPFASLLGAFSNVFGAPSEVAGHKDAGSPEDRFSDRATVRVRSRSRGGSAAKTVRGGAAERAAAEPAAAPAAGLAPFVFVPGLTAQQIEAKLDNAAVPRWWCPRNKDWFTIWLETSMVVPGLNECFFSNFAQIYDPVSDTFKDSPGVQTRAKGYGSWSSILTFEIFKKQVPMYQTLYTNLTAYGYVDGETMFAAQYDFRNDPYHIMKSEYFNNTVNLIETASQKNGGAKVWLVGHSYGCSMSHFFLQQAPQGWKDKYIAGYVSFSGPYLGAPVTVLVAFSGAFSSGHNGGVNLNATLLSHAAQRMGVSNALYPFPRWNMSGDTIVGLAGTNYTVEQLPEALNVIGGDALVQQYKGVYPTYNTLAPNVTVHCVNGYGSPTIYQSFFNTTKPMGVLPTSVTYIDGDTVVPRSSLNECQSWASKQDYPVTSREIPGLIHGVGPWQIFNDWMKLMNP